MTKSMHKPVAADAFVRTVPPIGYVLGNSSVSGPFAQRSAHVGVDLVADDVAGVLPRGVPV